jgi:hypothetical protein
MKILSSLNSAKNPEEVNDMIEDYEKLEKKSECCNKEILE